MPAPDDCGGPPPFWPRPPSSNRPTGSVEDETVVLPAVQPANPGGDETIVIKTGNYTAAPSGGDETIAIPTGRRTAALPDGDETIAIPTGARVGGEESPDETATVAKNSAVMAVGSIVSRVTGFLRTAVLAAALGAEAVNDDYTLANNLPNMVYELLLGGMLAGVVVPVLVRARRVERDGGEAYTQRLLTLATVFFGGATVLAVLAAPLLTALLLTGNHHVTAADRSLTTTLAYLLLPEIFFYGIAAILSAVLNVRGHFAAPMWTPILNNFVVMATAGVFALLHASDSITPESLATSEIAVLGIGTTLGIVVQAAGMWPALRKVGFQWRWRWDFGRLRLRELADLGGWMLAYVVLSEIGVMVIFAIAKNAGSQHGPGPAIYNNAFLVLMMAHGIVAVSIMTALMPRMSAAAADGRKSDFSAQLSLGTRLSAVILIPASVGYVVLGRPLAITLFQAGRYDSKGAIATGWVIAAAGLALVPYAISQLQTFAFYALSDARTPALINIPMVAVRIAAGIALLALVSPKWVVMGLMVASAASFVLGTALGYWVLRRHVGHLGLGQIARSLLRLTAAAGVGGVAALPVVWGLGALIGTGKLASAIQLVAGTLVLLAGYIGTAVLLRTAEVREVAEMVGSRFRR